LAASELPAEILSRTKVLLFFEVIHPQLFFRFKIEIHPQ